MGQIQPHAFLIEASSDWLVTRASDNLGLFLPLGAAEALGRPVADILGRNATHEVRGQLQINHSVPGVSRLLGVVIGEAAFDITVHRRDGATLIEGERAMPGDADLLDSVQPLVLHLRRIPDPIRLLTQAVRQVRALSGFDRVMLYRFHPDGSGEVIVETRRAEMAAYKGLRYPASDIPRQARALYETNPIRLIADVAAAPVRVSPALDPEGQPVDLSLAGSRAVSPVHLEYLRNMGVGGAMSISILVGGRLWGLIACHHRKARLLSVRARAALEFFGDYLSAVLEMRLLADFAARQDAARALHGEIMGALAAETASLEDLFPHFKTVQGMIAADGFATYVDGRLRFSGKTPGDGDALELMRFLNRATASRIYATHALASVFPEAAAYAETVSGVLAVAVPRKPRDFVLFFRQELVQAVSWGGDPTKSPERSGGSERISPRRSFEAWRETVRGQSAHWSESDLAIAEALRVALIEFTLQVTDRAEKQRRVSSEQQDLLIAELNHRVRNILNLIVGLVRQVSDSASDVGSFAAEVNERVHALARAHDQLTSTGWGPRSVMNMIRVEAAAYLAEKARRVQIRGDDVYIQPSAFATLALVVHELMTNAAKYGAFRNSLGTVDVELGHDERGLTLKWQERGGAPVKAPTRRGFGSTIIQRAIPHELSGTATMHWDSQGLRAELFVPAEHVAEQPPVEMIQSRPEPVDVAVSDRMEGNVLLVEDNLLIALETEDALYVLGAEDVHIASTVAAATAYLRESRPDFAVLDYNLGSESSSPVAERLAAAGVPFVLATGYGDTSIIDARFRSRPIIPKPYTSKSLLDAYNAAVASAALAAAVAMNAET